MIAGTYKYILPPKQDTPARKAGPRIFSWCNSLAVPAPACLGNNSSPFWQLLFLVQCRAHTPLSRRTRLPIFDEHNRPNSPETFRAHERINRIWLKISELRWNAVPTKCQIRQWATSVCRLWTPRYVPFYSSELVQGHIDRMYILLELFCRELGRSLTNVRYLTLAIISFPSLQQQYDGINRSRQG